MKLVVKYDDGEVVEYAVPDSVIGYLKILIDTEVEMEKESHKCLMWAKVKKFEQIRPYSYDELVVGWSMFHDIAMWGCSPEHYLLHKLSGLSYRKLMGAYRSAIEIHLEE